MGFSNSTDSAFAEIVLDSLPDDNRRNVSKKEVSCYHNIMLMVTSLCCFD